MPKGFGGRFAGRGATASAALTTLVNGTAAAAAKEGDSLTFEALAPLSQWGNGLTLVVDGVDGPTLTAADLRAGTAILAPAFTTSLQARLGAGAGAVLGRTLGLKPPSTSTAPVISGTPEIGQTLTATAGTWSRTYDEIQRRWTADNVVIDGEVAATLVLTAALDQKDIRHEVSVRDTGGTWSAWAASAPVAVTYTAPTAAAALADVTYTRGTGIQTVNAAADFTNATGGNWSVSPAWVSIDASGVVSIPTDRLRNLVSVTVTYTNSGGSAASAFSVTVADVPDQMTAPTLSSITSSSMDATLAPSPSENNSPITGYDLRYSTDSGATWTAVVGVTSPHSITGLPAATDTDVQTRAVNSIGAGAWSASARATTAAGAATIPTTSTTTIDHGNGTTLTLGAAAPVFQWADGSYGVVVSSAASIVNDAPASVLDGDGYRMHGMQIDPAVVTLTTGTQGFDQLISDAVLDKKTFRVPYDPAKNIAPSMTGTPVSLPAGEIHAVTKVVRRLAIGSFVDTDGTTKREGSNILDDIRVVTTVPAAPEVGAIRPPITGNYGSLLNIADADFSRVRSFTLPAITNTLADCRDYVRRPQLHNHNEGEPRRGLCVGQNYARDIISNVLAPAALYMLDPNCPSAERDAILAGFMMRATDAYGAYQAGLQMWGGAGQIITDHFAVSLIAALCPAKTEFATLAEAMRSNLNDQSHWALASEVGVHDETKFMTVAGAGKDNNHNQAPLLPEHVGYAAWIADGRNDPSYKVSEANTLNSARYRDVAYGMTMNGVNVLGLIAGGWEMIWGPQATWDSSNYRFATLMTMDQMREISGTAMISAGANDANPYTLTLWDAHRATYPEGGTAVPVQDAPPMQIAIDMVAAGLLTPTATGLDYNYDALAAGFDASTLPITAREIRLSHDGVQFAAPVAAGVSGSLAFTGSRWVQERRSNSLGWCPWSVNFPLFNGIDGVLRNIVSGGAIPAGAPVNVEVPKLYTYRYGDKPGYWLYDEAAGTMLADKTILIAGAGLWQDGIVGITYQWESRNNAGAPADIVGATGQTWTRDPALLSDASNSRDVRCKITVDDGAGASTVVYAPWLAMPTKVMVEDTLTTAPAAVYADPTGATYTYQSADGSIRCTPNETGFASFGIPLPGLFAGVTYDFTVEVTAKSGSGQLDLVVGQEGAAVDSLGTSGTRLSGPGTITLAGVVVPDDKEVRVAGRWRGAAPAGAYFDITRVAATPA